MKIKKKKTLHTCGLIVQFRLLSNQFTLLRIYFFLLPFFFNLYQNKADQSPTGVKLQNILIKVKNKENAIKSFFFFFFFLLVPSIVISRPPFR